MYLWSYSFRPYLQFVTVGEGRNKDQLSSLFTTTDWYKANICYSLSLVLIFVWCLGLFLVPLLLFFVTCFITFCFTSKVKFSKVSLWVDFWFTSLLPFVLSLYTCVLSALVPIYCLVSPFLLTGPVYILCCYPVFSLFVGDSSSVNFSHFRNDKGLKLESTASLSPAFGC